jgi:hypothetical protein
MGAGALLAKSRLQIIIMVVASDRGWRKMLRRRPRVGGRKGAGEETSFLRCDCVIGALSPFLATSYLLLHGFLRPPDGKNCADAVEIALAHGKYSPFGHLWEVTRSGREEMVKKVTAPWSMDAKNKDKK